MLDILDKAFNRRGEKRKSEDQTHPREARGNDETNPSLLRLTDLKRPHEVEEEARETRHKRDTQRKRGNTEGPPSPSKKRIRLRGKQSPNSELLGRASLLQGGIINNTFRPTIRIFMILELGASR